MLAKSVFGCGSRFGLASLINLTCFLVFIKSSVDLIPKYTAKTVETKAVAQNAL